MPVMRWVGMLDVSTSTVKIWDMMDTRLPFLNNSCLPTWNENVWIHPDISPIHPNV